MSDGKGWVGNADRDRIRGLMARSVHVIATAREGLDKSSTDLEHLSGASEPGSSKRKSRRPKMAGFKLPGSKGPLSKTPLSNTHLSKTHLSKTPLSKTPGPKLPEQKTYAKPKLPNPRTSEPRPPEAKLSLEPLPPLEPMRPLESKSSLAPYVSVEPVDAGQTASGRRRTLFRRFLQTRDLEDVRLLELFRRSNAEDADAEEIVSGTDGDDPADGTKGWLSKFRKKRAERRAARPAEARPASLDTEAFDALILDDDADRDDLNRDGPGRDNLFRDNLDRDDVDRDGLDRNGLDRNGLDRAPPWKDARFTDESWEWRGAEPDPERRSKLSIFVSWTQRLDSLTNTVAGVLILTLLSFWTIGVGEPVPAADKVAVHAAAEATPAPDPVVNPEPAHAEAGVAHAADPVAALIANAGLMEPVKEQKEAQPPSAHGFRVLSTAFPKPLPAKPEDISTMHSWARASLASAPGLVLLPYTGLPQAIPAMPPDIAGHILITTPQ